MMKSNIKLNGEPTAQSLANGLATLGRYGDNYMVHAAEGETFVPKEILDANPALKTQLFDQMRSMGIKDPNRYVVGDALNSINPITGQPEFFFKKIFKAVKKVFKKALPVVAPIIGNLIAPGIGGLIASGLTTKLQGGSWSDALKSAGMAYAGGALTQGIMGGLAPASTGQTFMGGLTKGVMAPFQAAQGLVGVGDYANPLKQGIFGGLGSDSGSLMSGSYFNPTTASGAEKGFMDYVHPSYNPTGGPQTMSKEFINTSGDTNAALGPKRGGTARIIPVEKSGLGQSKFITQGGASNIDDLRTGAGYEADMVARAKAEEIAMGGINAPSSNIARTKIIPKQPLTGVLPPFEPNPVPGYPNVEVGDVSQAALNRAAEIQQKAMEKAYVDGKFIGENFVSPDDALQQALVGSTAKPELSFMDKVKKFGSEKLLSKEVLGPALAAGIPAALTYVMADDEVSEEDQAKMTDPQRSAYEQYKAGKARNPNFAQTPEGRNLLRQAGITPTRTAEQLSRSTGVSLADAQGYLNRKYGVEPLSGIQLASVNIPSTNNLAAPMNIMAPVSAQPQALTGVLPPNVMAAAGGEIKGPGSGTSDSIPAMLSDGEFVMTAQAVRNAGNGDRDLGAARMYDMMNKFERAV